MKITGNTTYNSHTAYTAEEWNLAGDGVWAAKDAGRQIIALNPGIPVTGSFSTGDFALARAAIGAGGLIYDLIPVSAGTSSYSTQSIALDADFSVTSGTNFQTVTRSSGNMAITVSTAGSYRLSWQVTGTVTYNAGAVGTPYIVCRIYDGFGGLADSECTVCYSPLNSLTAQGTVSGFIPITVARTYTLQAVVNLPISGTLNVANIKFDNNTGGTLAYPGATHMLLEKFA